MLIDGVIEGLKLIEIDGVIEGEAVTEGVTLTLIEGVIEGDIAIEGEGVSLILVLPSTNDILYLPSRVPEIPLKAKILFLYI
jgi:hypothetical protein